MGSKRVIIGRLVGGGMKQNLLCQLENISIEDVPIGSPVVIKGLRRDYFSLVVDTSYDLGPDPRIIRKPPKNRLPDHMVKRISQKTIHSDIELMLNLSVEEGQKQPAPVTAIPSIQSPVFMASAEDLFRIFGDPEDTEKPGNFVIGYTREQGLPITIDLKKFTERSSGIFGATGAGKTFLARVILSGIIAKELASLLVFDMHNEFGYLDTNQSGAVTPGLKTIFPEKVMTFALGRGTKIRGQLPDHFLEISLSDLETGDINLLSKILNLTDATPTVEHALVHQFGKNWLKEFMRMMRIEGKAEETGSKKTFPPGSVSAWASKAGVSHVAANALWSKLRRLMRSYVVDQPAENSIPMIISALRQGIHCIISFGDFVDDLDYLLVANLITRLVAEAWNEDADRYRTTQKTEPHHLIIAIEESHKFLSPELAPQTPFGDISREMRKSYLNLLVIDQRPSQIDDEVMSQIVNRLTGWLGEDRDVQAVLSGFSNRDSLRRILSSLHPNGQMLIAGYLTPTPIAIRCRWVNDQFVDEIHKLM